MKSSVLTEFNQFQNNSHGDIDSGSTGNAPVCHKCSKPMTLEWSDSISEIKQLWSCLRCSFYIIIDPRFTKTEMLSSTSSSTIIGTQSI